MDKIYITDLKIFAYHGVFAHENLNGQNFYINAVLTLDTEQAGISDELACSVNYGEVCKLIKKTMTEHNYKLIEAVAQSVATAILCHYKLVKSVEIEIKKPEAPINMEFGCVSVKIKRSWHTAVIALGSNIGNSKAYINNAIQQLRESIYISDLQQSELIMTKPYGYTEQNNFLNGAVLCKTIYSPHGLLKFMQSIENNAGRTREIHWGPRTLDLDLIFYDNKIINTPDLIIPHPDMHNRDFVLKPVAELVPNYYHPVFKQTIKQLLEGLPHD